MPEISYKILAAQRLGVDPNALLNYFELREHCFVTTADGRQRIFSFAELRSPANDIAEKAQKGPSAAPGEAKMSGTPANNLAEPPARLVPRTAKEHRQPTTKKKK